MSQDYEFDFGLSDILDQNAGGRTLGAWVGGGLGVIFFLLSALTTAAFFYRFAPGLGFLFGPAVGPYASAAMGVICLDLAALAWGYVRARGCSSRGQQVLAAVIGAADLVGALLVSGLYVILAGGGLDAGVYDAAGAITEAGRGLHLLGTLVITAALVVNFAGVWLFAALSADTRQAAHATELAAVVREGQHKISTMRARQVIGHTMHAIAEDMPTAAASVAGDNKRRYLAHTMRQLSEGDQAAKEPAAVNGKGPDFLPGGRS